MIVSKIVVALISPLGTSIVLGVAAMTLAMFRVGRIALAIGLAGLLWLGIWSLPEVSIGFRAALESEYPPVEFSSLPTCQAAVVLSGAMSPPDARHAEPDLNRAADRVRAAAQVYHAGKAPLLVLSGGGDPARWPLSEAEAMRTVLREFGVPDDAMLLEGRSRDTRENARFSAELLRGRGIDRVLLITSALHMRRSLRHFAHEGIEVVPVATDHEARAVPEWRSWIPDTDALDGSARAIKEWVGQRLPPSWG